MKTHLTAIALFIAVAIPTAIFSQPSDSGREPGSRSASKGGGNTPSLTPNQEPASAGFDTARAGIARGKVETIEYQTKTGGEKFRAAIYTPPGYSTSRRYPVLYLLHGASGDETTWVKDIRAAAILDNLYADKKLAPMIVVMPSMLSVSARGQANLDREAKTRAGTVFAEVLLRDLVHVVESKYPAQTGRDHRALAGLSMGAGIALGTGLTHPDEFAWIGAFSGGSTRRLASDTRLDLASPGRNPSLLWISVGDQDKMMAASVSATDAFLTEKNIPHVFRINTGAHEPKVWMNDLYYFAPLLFKP